MEELSGGVNPIALIFTICMGVLTLIMRREYALIPIIAAAVFITLGQYFAIAGAHLDMLRLLILLGGVRILVRGELRSLTLNSIDKAVLLWIASNVILNTVLYGDTQAFLNRIGYALKCVGSYFIARALIKDEQDAIIIIKSLAVMLIPLAVAMFIERITLRNIFYIFGGVPQLSMIRDGKLRAQGPFLHPILTGTFGATLFPLIISLWWSKYKKIAIYGVVSAVVIVVTSASSGPAIALILGSVAMLMWRLRHKMRLIRWTIVISLIMLHMIMEAPVWFLIGKLGNLTGGGGWHRAEIIDTSIRHINEWWLLGTTYTRHWMATGVSWSPDHTDITNMFIRQGVDGGLLTMLLFIIIIVKCYKGIGQSLKNIGDSNRSSSLILWCMGSALFAHIASFLSVAYFDQMLFFWHLLLAMIASVTSIYTIKSVRENSSRTIIRI